MSIEFLYFQKDVVFLGKHARYIDEMWTQERVEQKDFFNRLYELYVTACIVGLRTGRRAPLDSSDGNKRTIQAGNLSTQRDKLDALMNMALVAAAGPGANLILGLISSIFYGFFLALYSFLYYKLGYGFILTCVYWITVLCELGAAYNFLFMVFNLIPIPPFDGSRIALLFLPTKFYFGVMRYERQIMLGVLIALFLLSRFDISPFSFIANKLTDLIAIPITDLFWNIFKKALLP